MLWIDSVRSLAYLLDLWAQHAQLCDERLLLRREGLGWLQEPKRRLPDCGRFERRLGLQTLGALLRREKLLGGKPGGPLQPRVAFVGPDALQIGLAPRGLQFRRLQFCGRFERNAIRLCLCSSNGR